MTGTNVTVALPGPSTHILPDWNASVHSLLKLQLWSERGLTAPLLERDCDWSLSRLTLARALNEEIAVVHFLDGPSDRAPGGEMLQRYLAQVCAGGRSAVH